MKHRKMAGAGGKGYGAKAMPSASMSGGGAVTKVAQSDQRSDSTAKVSNKNPYPDGLA